MVELHINPELDALIPKPTEEECAELANSIKENGQHQPLVVWKDEISGKTYIVDGHTRNRILKEQGIEPKIEFGKFGCWLEASKYAIQVNRVRRHLSPLQKVQLVLREIEIEKKLAKDRQKQTIPKKGQKGFQSPPMPDGIHTGRTVDIVAKKTGFSSRTAARLKKINDEGSEELKKAVASGKTSPARAEKIINREKIRTNPIPLPNGKFRVILCDAPFKYDYELQGSPPYPTLTVDEIINLKDKEGRPITAVFAEDAIILFWSPIPKLEESMRILKEWGFTFKSGSIWSKEKDCQSQWGNGHYTKATCEVLLIATKGKIGIPLPKDRLPGIIRAPRTKIHSQKPSSVRRLIMKAYPNEKYLELFARESVEGWVPWGDQLDLPDSKESSKKGTLDDYKD